MYKDVSTVCGALNRCSAVDSVPIKDDPKGIRSSQMKEKEQPMLAVEAKDRQCLSSGVKRTEESGQLQVLHEWVTRMN